VSNDARARFSAIGLHDAGKGVQHVDPTIVNITCTFPQYEKNCASAGNYAL
jgi:hypothetical protein